MLKGLTAAGIGQINQFEQMVELASKYGFDTVDAGGDRLIGLIERQGLEGAREYLQQHRIRIASIGLNVEWRTSEEVFREGLAELSRNAAAAAALGCSACCTYVLPSTDYNAAHFMALATSRLRTCAEILDAYGLRLGLEFVGPHHLRSRWKNPFIWEMSDTLDWISSIRMPNIGLLLDAYHWYTTAGTVQELLALSPEQIVHVHINDAPDLPLDKVMDNERLYPGEGVIPLDQFLKALSHIGYRGSVAQEVLTPEPPQDTPEILVQKSAAAFHKVFSAAGL